MWSKAVLLVLAPLCSLGGGFLVPSKASQRRCEYIRTYGMHAADCRNTGISEIPHNLNGNIETLDVTYNRIREITNTSLEKYPYLRILYLDDNMISYIESAAFDSVPDLEILSLSWNSLHHIPDAIYSLQYLRKLYLSNNPFIGGFDFKEPLRSVEVLDISKCKFTELPRLEALPRLLTLNASYNRIKSVNVVEMAPMCRLRDIYLQGNAGLFRHGDGACECILLVEWTKIRLIRTQPEQTLLCPGIVPGLTPFDNMTCFNNETVALFQESRAMARSCEAQVLEYGSGPIRLKGSLVWTIGVMTACALLITCFASVYFVRRRSHAAHSARNPHSAQRFETDFSEEEYTKS